MEKYSTTEVIIFFSVDDLQRRKKILFSSTDVNAN